MTQVFIGKWTFTSVDGEPLGIDHDGRLALGTDIAAPAQRFNAYGSDQNFIWQSAVTSGAGAGKYLAGTGDGYTASLDRDGSPACFGVEEAGSNRLRLIDIDRNAYLNAEDGGIGRVPKTGSPPATTLFLRTVLTKGTEFIKSWGAQGKDLTWVYWAGVQLPSGLLTNATLSFADLTAANLKEAYLQSIKLDNADLTGAVLQEADLSGSVLDNAKLKNARIENGIINGAKLRSADLTGAKLNGVPMNNADCTEAVMNDTDMTNGSVNNAVFAKASLKGAVFSKATFRGTDIRGADLSMATLSNPDPSLRDQYIDFRHVLMDKDTCFAGAQLKNTDFSGHDLTGMSFTHANLTNTCLDNTNLSNTEMSYANLTQASLKGGNTMTATNLSNAVLTGANATGAQMGSISLIFRVAGSSQVEAFKTALQQQDSQTVKTIFQDNGVTLEGHIDIEESRYAPGRVWTVKTADQSYTVRLESRTGGDTLAVYQPGTSAILVNAFLKDAILTGANLYNVRASGAQICGNAKLDGFAILEKAQFDSANLTGINFKQAQMQGINLNHATLNQALFQGANLEPDSDGGQVSLNSANLQGANFSDAKLTRTIFTDAAVAVADPDDPLTSLGVWLFTIADAAGADCLAELNAAQNAFYPDLSLSSHLTPGKADAEVISCFKKNGINLSSDALVTVLSHETEWEVLDGADTYLIYRSCDTDQYVPALAVEKTAGVSGRFTIPLYLEKDLVSGPVNAELKSAFKTYGHIDLGDGARIIPEQQPVMWQVADVSANYTIWQGLDEFCEPGLTVRHSIPNLIAAFTGHSTALGQRATVSSRKSGRYVVKNDVDNPYNRTTGYIQFTVFLNPDKSLDVYGAAIRVTQLNPDNKKVFRNVRCNTTVLPGEDLTDSTICPNSERTEINRKEGTPYILWMRAKALPRPPFCVPSLDGTYYCPATPYSGNPGSSLFNP